jgi:hypothetical protein
VAMPEIEAVIDEEVAAYRARDIDGFLRCFAPTSWSRTSTATR